MGGGEGFFQFHGEFRHVVVAHEIEHGQFAQAFFRFQGHLEVGHFAVHGHELLAHSFGELAEELIRIRLLRGVQGVGGVQPAEQGFAICIHFIIHVHHGARDLRGLGEFLEPLLQSFFGAGGDGHDFRQRKIFRERRFQFRQFFRGEQIAFVDHDDVRFLQLLAVDVFHLLGEAAAFFQTQHARGADGVHQYAERGDGVIFPIHAAKGIRDGGDEVCATAHGLGDEHLGQGAFVQAVRGFHQGIETAAETAAGDLLHLVIM